MFEVQSRYYVHFWTNTLGKSMNSRIPASYGLNSIIIVLLQRWFWHYITHEGRYAINQTKRKAEDSG